jgi:hypothetical protein
MRTVTAWVLLLGAGAAADAATPVVRIDVDAGLAHARIVSCGGRGIVSTGRSR